MGPSPTASLGEFALPTPPPETATWTGIDWRRLASNDPLRLVGSVLHWKGGYVALGGRPSAVSSGALIWTSLDGARWDLSPYNTSTSFWPGLVAVAVAESPTGLVALTELGAGNGCQGQPACELYSPPAIALVLVGWPHLDTRCLRPGRAQLEPWCAGADIRAGWTCRCLNGRWSACRDLG